MKAANVPEADPLIKEQGRESWKISRTMAALNG
jgi:hypothetical protein